MACKCFSQEIFEKSDIEQKNLTSEEDMRSYFASFSKDSSNEANHNHKDINNYNKFMAKRIYKGYIDDPRNTVGKMKVFEKFLRKKIKI